MKQVKIHEYDVTITINNVNAPDEDAVFDWVKIQLNRQPYSWEIERITVVPDE